MPQRHLRIRLRPFDDQTWISISGPVSGPERLFQGERFHAWLDGLVPAPLAVETYQGWAFVAVAMVRTRGLRPSGLPGWLGRTFILLGYRAFVRFGAATGRSLRGLYILRSDTDRWSMKALGNTFTEYGYRHVDISWQTEAHRTTVRSRRGGVDVKVASSERAELPTGSGFASWKAARRFAGPMPHTFAVEPSGRRVLVVRGRRGQWRQLPVNVESARITAWQAMGLADTQLWSAFEIRDVDYHWAPGYWMEAKP